MLIRLSPGYYSTRDNLVEIVRKRGLWFIVYRDMLDQSAGWCTSPAHGTYRNARINALRLYAAMLAVIDYDHRQALEENEKR